MRRLLLCKMAKGAKARMKKAHFAGEKQSKMSQNLEGIILRDYVLS